METKAEPRNEKGQTLAEFLAAYDENKYRRPSVTVDMVVLTLNERGELCVMLIRRRNHPFIGRWALPGGFVEMDEELSAAAAREYDVLAAAIGEILALSLRSFERQETGVTGIPLRGFGTFGAVDRDPRTRVITSAFYAVAPMGSIAPQAGDDAADAKLFTINTELEAYSASAERYRITLTNGEETLL